MMKKINLEIYSLARICNDIENVELYNVSADGECWYNEKNIGKIRIDYGDEVKINFIPYNEVESIEVKFNVGSDEYK